METGIGTDEGVEDGWVVTRSPLDDRVWVPIPSGVGDVAELLSAGSLRRVKAHVEAHHLSEPGFRWRRLDADRWFFGWVERDAR